LAVGTCGKKKRTARGRAQIRQQTTDHEPLDTTRGSGFVGVGMELPYNVGTKIICAGHEIIIPANNRHNGILEENLLVAVVQQTIDENYTTKFLETELADFNFQKSKGRSMQWLTKWGS